jgi:beta-lactamase regulating signal transducer with metallopeptidase domain
MNTLETGRSIIEVLGWALIHFIWQGALVALSLAGVLRILRGASTNARYGAACVALLLMSSLPLFTMTIIGLSMPDKTASGPQQVEIEPAVVLTQTDAALASPLPWLSILSVKITPLLPWMIPLWLSGVAFFSLRMMGGWLYAQRLKSYGTRPLEKGWEQTLRRLCDQLRAPRPARLLESALVKAPIVVGWLRPVILLPASALAGLTTQQLEAIIAHELAHIRRHDYLINLLQAMIETLLFYHPAVWWVSRKIRQEREHCCDDLAVGVCGDAFIYSRALLEMEQLRAAGPRLAMAANGGLLMNRIQRLIGAQPKHASRFSGLFAGVIMLITLISAGAGAQILLQSSSRPDRDVVSVRKREAGKVNTAAEAPGESKGADAGQQAGSVQNDSAVVKSLRSLSPHGENERARRKAALALREIEDSPAQASADQEPKPRTRMTKYTGRLAGVTKTLELKFQAAQPLKKARLKINGQIKSGAAIWTLRDPNGKSAFTAESNKAELSLDSGDLELIPGTWILQLELKKGLLDFEVLWTTH